MDGEETSDFRSRPVTADAIQAADLILTADRTHRSAVVQLAPSALGKTFCLREFARLLSSLDLADLPDDPVAWARASVVAARDGRGLIPSVPREQEEVADPLGRDQAVHREAVLLICTALARSSACRYRPAQAPVDAGPDRCGVADALARQRRTAPRERVSQLRLTP